MLGAAVVFSGAFIALPVDTATAAQNVLRADGSAARSCSAGLLPKGTAGVDRRELTSAVGGLVQARLTPAQAAEGDWDLAVFDKASGTVVAASAALRSHELAEGFVRKGQTLVVQGCRYGGLAKSVRLGVDFLALESQGTSAGSGPSAPRAELVRVETPTRADKNRLLRLGLDVTEKGDATGLEVVLVGDADHKTLADSGFRSKVIEADLSAKSVQDAKADQAYAATTVASPLPSGRTGYRHLYDYEFEMKELARKNHRLVSVFTLPEPTWEGRDVVGMEIATDVQHINDGKPVNFTMGIHHAREWPAGEHAMEWAYELINGYYHDSTIGRLVGRTRNVIVPVVNPDGFEISREAEPKGDYTRFDYEMKRKNCNVHDSPSAYATGVCRMNPAGRERGTDPNRNYAGFWGGSGAGLAWNGDTFRGSAPFSEPEVRNVRSIVSSRQVTNLITLHTAAGLVLRPPGLADTRPPLDEPAYKALGAKIASRNGYVSEPTWKLYDTTGGTEDWSYWATGGWGFTIEIGGSGFHSPYEDAVVAEYEGLAPAAGAGKGGNRRALLDMLANAADPAEHSTLIGSAPKGHRLNLYKAFRTPTSPVLQPDGTTEPPIYVTDELNSTFTPAGGRFTWSVNPSTRPYVAGRYGRDPQGPPQQSGPVANPPGMPAPNENYPGDPTSESFTFHVDGLPEADNGKLSVDISWKSPNSHWDLYLYDASGNPVVSSTSGETSEHAVLFDPPAGDYEAVLVNVAQANPAEADDWTGGVSFASPIPATYGEKESYQLTCTSPKGRLVGLKNVYSDRGQTVDVGEICTRPAHAGD
ncbi:M14 family zinc carboxypeptidase [Streptomyces sp. NPDC055210]